MYFTVMHFIHFQSIKIAVGNYHGFLETVKKNLIERNFFLFSALTKESLNAFILTKRKRKIAERISLFFCEERALVATLKKNTYLRTISFQKVIHKPKLTESADEKSKASPKNVASKANVGKDYPLKGNISKIPAYLLFHDVIGFAIERGLRVGFLGFSTEIETKLKYNLAMLHGLQTKSSGNENKAIAQFTHFFFLHQQAIISSNANDVEAVLRKMAPNLIICHEKAVITFRFHEIVKELKSCFFWLDNATLLKATKQKNQPRKKRMKLLARFLKTLLVLPVDVVRGLKFLLSSLLGIVILLPKTLFSLWLLGCIRRAKVKTFHS